MPREAQKKTFILEVTRLIAAVPPGRVVTYGQIAAWASRPWASRGVSMVAHARARRDTLPWHRLVRANGRIKFPRNSELFALQSERLRREGVRVVDGAVDLHAYGWTRRARAKRDPKQPRMFS